MSILVVYDTETTGVDHTARIVELAAIVITPDGSRLFCERANPGIPIPAGASGVHGIYDHQVEDCRPAAAVAAAFLAEVAAEQARHGGALIMAGHNTQFDARRVAYYQPLPEHQDLCSLKLARQLSPDAPSHKLASMIAHLNLPGGYAAHSALDDCRMALALLAHYAARTGLDYTGLAERQRRPAQLKTMHFGRHKGLPFSALPADYMTYMLGLPDLDADVKFSMQQELAARG